MAQVTNCTKPLCLRHSGIDGFGEFGTFGPSCLSGKLGSASCARPGSCESTGDLGSMAKSGRGAEDDLKRGVSKAYL